MIDEILVEESIKETEDENNQVEVVLEENAENSCDFEKVETEEISDFEVSEETAIVKNKIKFGDVLFNRKAKVFVKVNKDGFITQVDSDVFLKDTTGWAIYDEGEGERFVYAQTAYFEEPLVDDDGNFRYKV